MSALGRFLRLRLPATAPAAIAWCMLLCAAGPALSETPAAARRGQAFWLALAKDCKVPAGETGFGLVGEALDVLGSPDSSWRDDVGYGVVASCVYRSRALTAAERRKVIERLSANLRVGIGGGGDDSVLRRSFSALDLSIFAALELADPALDPAGYRTLLESAFAYLEDEHDLRGLEPRVGWIHATAHTADLLKFLARDPRFTPADQRRLLEGAWSKLTAPGTPVFTHAEDERLAAAIASVVRRADFAAPAFQAWLVQFPALENQVWSQAPPDARKLDAAQNARNLLRALFVALSLPAPAAPGAQPAPAGPSVAAAREKVLDTLRVIRR
jgi:hypothetical protein